MIDGKMVSIFDFNWKNLDVFKCITGIKLSKYTYTLMHLNKVASNQYVHVLSVKVVMRKIRDFPHLLRIIGYWKS